MNNENDELEVDTDPKQQPAKPSISGGLICDPSGAIRPMTAEEHLAGVVKRA